MRALSHVFNTWIKQLNSLKSLKLIIHKCCGRKWLLMAHTFWKLLGVKFNKMLIFNWSTNFVSEHNVTRAWFNTRKEPLEFIADIKQLLKFAMYNSTFCNQSLDYFINTSFGVIKLGTMSITFEDPLSWNSVATSLPNCFPKYARFLKSMSIFV